VYFDISNSQPFHILAVMKPEFWSKTKHTASGCIEWTGSKNDQGYGMVFKFMGQKQVRAHRISYRIANGSWPSDYVLHSCDNPSCVNPDHLRNGSHKENSEDAVARKRTASRERSGQSKLTEECIAKIRSFTFYSNKDLAKMLGVHPSTISRVRSNKIWVD
jgi:hypothetical protein